MSAHERLGALISEFDERMTAHLKRIRLDIEEHPEPHVHDGEEVRLLRAMVREIHDVRASLSEVRLDAQLAA